MAVKRDNNTNKWYYYGSYRTGSQTKQYKKRGSLYTAAGRRGGRAYKHEKHHNDKSGFGKLPERICRKARGTRGYALEKRAQPAYILRKLQKQSATDDQHCACKKHGLCVQRKLAVPYQSLGAQLPQYGESQSAAYNKRAGHKIEKNISLVRGKALHISENVKPRVVKSGN